MRHLFLIPAIAFGAALAPLSAAMAQQAPDAAAPAATKPLADSFLGRFVDNYRDHLNYTGEGSEPLKTRDQPTPLDSPPFPGVNYSFGGSPVIGVPDTISSALTDTIWQSDSSLGKLMKDEGIHLYGWVEPGANWSSSHNKFRWNNQSGGNAPASYAVYPNSVMLDQFALYAEKVPDSVQTDHVDWGFRLTGVYGTDYKYTFSHDIASSQYMKQGHMYGYDPVMAYGDIYVPFVAEGMNIRIGRYISIPDIEAQLAPNNYTYSHSLLYGVDPYTQTGIVTTTKLTKNWTVQLELSGGNDIATWDSREVKLTPAACVSWTSDSGNDNIYPCINGWNGGDYKYNNIQHDVITWYHKFNAKWHMATEAYYMDEKNVPNLNNPQVAATPLAYNAVGAGYPVGFGYCGATGNSTKQTCFTKEYAMVNYLNYEIDPLNSISLRNEFYNDVNGQRMGVPTLYSSHLIGWQHWIGDAITFRPELRFDRAYNNAAFNANSAGAATAHNQIMLAADTIFHF